MFFCEFYLQIVSHKDREDFFLDDFLVCDFFLQTLNAILG